MVWKLDRLGRSLKHLIETIRAFEDQGVGFKSLQESIDTSTPAGRLVFHVFDFLYLGDRDFIQLGEDAGMFNKNARKLLHERLDLRNLCGHPTQYTPGREETVIFIESLLLNILSGTWLNWS